MNPKPDPGLYKLQPRYDKHGRLMNGPVPQRGKNAHEPVEMKEGVAWHPVREWFCPKCDRWEMRWKEDLPAGFVGISCAGDAVLEGVEG